MKNSLTPEMLCRNNEDTQVLLPFMNEIFALHFEEVPDYKKLKFLLVQALKECDLVPDEQYDWNWTLFFKANEQNQVENDCKNIENHNFSGLCVTTQEPV